MIEVVDGDSFGIEVDDYAGQIVAEIVDVRGEAAR
ncbi:hypothetical protein CFAL_07930 [Corynebacterium falsenii DSM 44353]|nr:hypothetical protein CFAL_07930 [Corynebacterium falsenii DSM 44353]